jgi:hypothetical protein
MRHFHFKVNGNQVISVLVGLVALTVYLPALAPDITWAHNGVDGGDLIATSFVGGAAHPPGYPLYALFGRVMAFLPVGSIPYRYNLFSALAAAGAAALVSWLIGKHSPMPALAAGLSLAFAPLVWSQAVITEVYALGTLFTTLVIVLSLQTKPHPLALGVAEGLSLTHHLTLIMLAPLVLAAWRHWAKEQGTQKVVLQGTLGTLVGLLPLAYLPLTSRAHVGWGDPSTLAGFWWLVSAQLYRGYVFALPAASVLPRVAEVARVLMASFTWVGVTIGLWGLVTLWGHDRWRGIGSLISTVALVAFGVGYNTADSEVYLIPVLAMFAVWIGLGWNEIIRDKVISRPILQVGLFVLMLTPSVVVLVREWPVQDLHSDRVARDFMDSVLAEAPAHAIVVTAEDRYTFTLWVGMFVEGRRTDLAVVDRDLLSYDWYRARLQRGFPGLIVPEVEGMTALARLNPDRPVCRLTGTSSPWLHCKD